MNRSDDGFGETFVPQELRDRMTPAAVSEALTDFVPSLVSGRDMVWLAMAVRRSLAISIPNQREAPERTKNADIRAELERLARLAGSTWLELFQCDDTAESRLWDHACDHWDGQGGSNVGNGIIIGEPLDYRRFKSAIAELDWLASFLRDAAKATASQRGPWRQVEGKRHRVVRGQFLAPVFEAAFGQPVSANNYPSDARHKTPTPFMDFYSRMVTLAFNALETSNLSEVVKAACQLHRHRPAEFSEGIIPGL